MSKEVFFTMLETNLSRMNTKEPNVSLSAKSSDTYMKREAKKLFFNVLTHKKYDK